MSRFNLVDALWIPCVLLDGSRRELGLRDVLCRAHTLREVYDPSPLVTVSVHRLLLAILHRLFGPADIREWVRLWKQGMWDADAVDRYFVQWRHRFELFDPERPFGQVPHMADTADHPIAALLLEAASGNNATLFDHGRVEGADAIPAGRAACYLLAHQAFAIGFGRSKPFYLQDAPLTRGLTVMALGDNLFETLALNLVSADHWGDCFPQKADDEPFWEWDTLPDPVEQGTDPRGRMDYLTWQSRRINLVPAGDPPRVSLCQIQQNYCLPGNPRRWDPFKRYRQDEKRGWAPASLSAEKAAWRDCHALLHMNLPQESRPEVLDWLGEIELLREEGRIEARPQYQLMVFGLATAAGKAASVELWRAERLPLPLAYLNNEDLLDYLKAALDRAREVGTVLRRTVWFLAGRLVTEMDVERLANQLSADNLFWPPLEEPFRVLLVELTRGNERQVLQDWKNRLGRVARDAFRGVWRQLETSAGVLKALVDAEGYFNRELAGALKSVDEERDHESAK